MKNIFIAYPAEDKRIAKKLTSKLEGKGYSCKIFPRDLIDKTKLKSETEKTISGSSIFVLLYSDFAERSKELTTQLQIASDNGLKIVPFKTGKISKSLSTDFILHQFEWIDSDGDGFDTAFDILLEIIEETNGGSSPMKRIKSSKAQENGTESNKMNYYIGAAVLVIALIIVYATQFYDNNDNGQEPQSNLNTQYSPGQVQNSQTDQTDTGDKLSLSENEQMLVGKWIVSEYVDNQPMSAKEKEQIKASIVGKGQLVFNADKRFFRIGFSPQVQIANWSYDRIRNVINLEINGRIEPINLSQFNDTSFTLLTTEQTRDSLGNVRPVTTKIVFSKVR